MMLTEQDIYQAELRTWKRRLAMHLDQIPELLHFLRERRVPLAASRMSERISGGGHLAATPFREDDVDAADALWAKLAIYVGEVAERLQDPAPGAVGASWATERGVEGLPAWMSPEDAHRAAWGLDSWVMDRAEKVYALSLTDTEDDLFATVRKLWARFMDDPPTERAEYRALCLREIAPGEYEGCGERDVTTLWAEGKEGVAMCMTCGQTYAPEGMESTDDP